MHIPKENDIAHKNIYNLKPVASKKKLYNRKKTFLAITYESYCFQNENLHFHTVEYIKICAYFSTAFIPGIQCSYLQNGTVTANITV